MRLQDKIAKAKQDLYVEKEQKYSKIILVILLWVWLISGITEHLTSKKVIFIENAHAESVSSEIVSGERADSDVQQPDSSVIKTEYRSEAAMPSSEVRELIAQYFPENAEKATQVFKCESELDASKHSLVDVMSDGRSFSVGLTQQNLTVTKLGGLDCPSAFKGINKYAKVIDEKLYEKCVTLAENPKISLETAKKKYERSGDFSAWYYCSNHKI